MTNPWVILGAVVVLIAAVVGGYSYGRHVQALADAVERDKDVQAAQRHAIALRDTALRQSAQDRQARDALEVRLAASQRALEKAHGEQISALKQIRAAAAPTDCIRLAVPVDIDGLLRAAPR